MKALFILLLLITASSGCERNKNKAEADYRIKNGEQFRLEMHSNPSTGYSWQWINRQSVHFVDTTGLEYLPDKPFLTGSGGTEIWIFEGIGRGTDTIKLEYCRSWEPNTPAFTKQIIVKVK